MRPDERKAFVNTGREPHKTDSRELRQIQPNRRGRGRADVPSSCHRPGKLAIASRQGENCQLLVSVTDTGVGLSPEQTEQIFKAFFTTKPQGTGMGLPISRAIIESHGGRLWATSSSGPGTTFQFTLPIEATAHEAA